MDGPLGNGSIALTEPQAPLPVGDTERLSWFDDFIGGLLGGGVYLLGGSPGGRKSGLATQLVLELATQNIPSVSILTEETERRFIERATKITTDWSRKESKNAIALARCDTRVNRRTLGHILETVSDVDAILTGCGFVYWDDLNAEVLKQWLNHQRQLREDFGPTTANHYITSIKAFISWCQQQLKRYGEANPFDQIEKFNTQEDIRRPRRPATADEIGKIVNATDVVGTVKGISAEDRAMLYQVALTLALRARECRSLYPENFTRDDDGLNVIINAADEKARRGAKIPVPAGLAAILEPWLAKKPKGRPLWPGNWYREAAEMLCEDLKVAGIECKTNDGYLDFHATRHTAITRGSRVMPVVDLKTFARHAKIETAMRYVHTDKQELRAGVDKLPVIGGNDGASSANKNDSKAPSEKCVRKCVRASGSTSQRASFSRTIWQRLRNDATPWQAKELSSNDMKCLQRARRGSNPQPPDRQSGTLTN
jgi:site-specific recombinase XerD